MAPRLDWKLVGALLPIGGLVGVLSLYGLWPIWAEAIVWAIVGALWILVLYSRRAQPAFWHGFTVAFLGGMLTILIQAVFTTTYLENNPDAAEGFGVDPQNPGAAVRWTILGTGLLITGLYGLIVGLAARLAMPKGRVQPSKET